MRPLLALLAVAAALVLWPEQPALRRWRRLTGTLPPLGTGAGARRPSARIVAGWQRLPLPLGAALLAAPSAWWLFGALPAIAAGLIAATAATLLRGFRGARRERRLWAELAARVRMLTRELRSGSPPAAAAELVAVGAGADVAQLLHQLAAQARWGLQRPIGGPAPVRAVGRQLSAGLRLAVRSGVPWAALVESAAVDIDARVRVAEDRAAQVAGPRFSGYVLAALPVFGLLLGAGIGADPLAVLLGPAPGGVLLPVGVLLCCAGLLWSARITAR